MLTWRRVANQLQAISNQLLLKASWGLYEEKEDDMLKHRNEIQTFIKNLKPIIAQARKFSEEERK